MSNYHFGAHVGNFRFLLPEGTQTHTCVDVYTRFQPEPWRGSECSSQKHRPPGGNHGGYLSSSIGPRTNAPLHTLLKKKKKWFVFLLLFHIWIEPCIQHLHSVLASTPSVLATWSFLLQIYWDLNFALFRHKKKKKKKNSRVLLLLAVHIKMFCFKFWPECLQNVVGSYTF